MSEMSYGELDATFQAAGGEQGIRHLVDTFYELMASESRFQEIFNWHPEDNEQSRDKLARFLCGWSGGPRVYQEKYGSINIISAHRHLPITQEHSELWLECMEQALRQCEYPDDFREYMLTQLRMPAERIAYACSLSS